MSADCALALARTSRFKTSRRAARHAKVLAMERSNLRVTSQNSRMGIGCFVDKLR